MGAFTSVTLVKSVPAPAGGDGVHMAMGTAVGPASYDSTGSILDLSAVFKSKVYMVVGNIDNADLRCAFVPGASYGSSLCKIFVDDNAGTEATGDLSTTMAVTEWFAWGTDG